VATADPDRPLRAAVNLVGGFAMGGRVHETPVEEFEKQFRLNLRPTYLVTQAALPRLLESGGGSIVCVGTRAALQPFSGAAGYVSSKAAVIAFAHAVAVEYREDGIRCNAILPSVIDTPANRAAMPTADHERWVKPAEIAGVIAHLLSQDSAPVSGATIPVYGRA
jgi:NAD(P)-dependent dehydrogenase (short-subunit alcohol dehydrogenase family)